MNSLEVRKDQAHGRLGVFSELVALAEHMQKERNINGTERERNLSASASVDSLRELLRQEDKFQRFHEEADSLLEARHRQ